MYVVGVDLVKAYKALIRLVGGGPLCPPSDVYIRSFLCPFFTFIKLCYTHTHTHTHTHTEKSFPVCLFGCFQILTWGKPLTASLRRKGKRKLEDSCG